MQLKLADEGIETLFGIRDENLRRIERAFDVRLTARGSDLKIEGDDEAVERVESLLVQLSELLDARSAPRSHGRRYGDPGHPRGAGNEARRAIRQRRSPRPGASAGQAAQRQSDTVYLKAMCDYDLVVSIGPAGTGKTYLAVAMAAAFLREERVRRIILARPAVEAGEKLGFLPGDLVEKVNPYLRPLYDALYDIIGFEKVGRMLDRGIIEVAPIAFMRGRTLNDSFVILDEAQNTTSEQMKMFLTRIGFNSKAVVNGDITQIDLPSKQVSGLRQAQQILRDIDGIEFVYFDQTDVVRHRLVQKIIGAYAAHDASTSRDTMSDTLGEDQTREKGLPLTP